MIDNNLIFRDIFFFSRADLAQDEELMDLFGKVCSPIVLVGIESTNQKSLDSINKSQKAADIQRFLPNFAKKG